MSVAQKRLVATIPAGQSLSNGILLGDYTLSGFYFPANWTNADISIQVSIDEGQTWVELNDAGGVAVTLAVSGTPTATAPSTYYAVDVRHPQMTSVTLMKIRSGLVGAPVAQANTVSVFVFGRRIYPTDIS